MADNTFRAIITVLDKATLPLRAIQRQMQALAAPIQKVGLDLAQVGKVAGIGKVAAAAGHLGKTLDDIGKKAGAAIKPLMTLGAVASVAGLVEMTKKSAEYGASLYDASHKIGIATAALGQYRYAAKLTGVDSEALDTGLVKLNRTIGDAAAGRNKQALALFHKLGISIRDSKGHLKSAADLMPQLAKAFEKNKDPAMRTAMAMALFGRAGAGLIPLLTVGADKMAAMRQEAINLGLAMSDEDATAAKENADAWTKLGFAVQGLSYTIGAKLGNVLTPLIEQMTAWIAANRELIGEKVATLVADLSDAVKTIVPPLARFLDMMGGIKSVAAAVAGILGLKLVASVMGAARTILTLGAAFARLGMALLLNPIGLIVLALAAVGFAAYELWKHWHEIWGWISVKLDWFLGKIKPFTDLVCAYFDLEVAAFRAVWHAAEWVFGKIAAGFEWIVGKVKAFIETVKSAATALGLLHDANDASKPADHPPAETAAGRPRNGTGLNPRYHAPPVLPPPDATARPQPLYGPGGVVRLASAPGVQPLQSLYGPGGLAAARDSAAAPQKSAVDVKVSFDNVPPGTRVTADSSGPVKPQVDVGRNLTGVPAFAY